MHYCHYNLEKISLFKLIKENIHEKIVCSDCIVAVGWVFLLTKKLSYQGCYQKQRRVIGIRKPSSFE
jgi:hypothetical protein